MELRVLRYFLAVAREESISAAAATLHITQPTLSRQLMDLEKELGCRLLIRGKRSHKISLTEEGMLLRRRAEEIVELADQTEAEFAAREGILGGNIYLGGGETNAMRLLARTAVTLEQKVPSLRFHLFSGNADDVCERLDRGLLDFGLLIGKVNLDKYEFISLPYHDVWGLLLRKDHPLSQKETICPSDLQGLPLWGSRQAANRNTIAAWAGDDLPLIQYIGTYNLIHNVSLMVAEGLGVAFCLDGLADTGPNSPLCFRPLDPPFWAPVVLVWKKHRLLSAPAQLFLNQIQQDATISSLAQSPK
mgnify:FL=1